MKKIHLFLILLFLIVYAFSVSTHENADTGINAIALRSEFKKEIHTLGGGGAYALVKKRYEHASVDIQHNIAHIFGETAYNVLGTEGIRACDASFAFGCYHGFFNVAVASEGSAILPALDYACGLVTEGDPSACRHGLGHGILEYLGNEKLEEALALCGETTQPNPITGCTSGVFMQFNIPITYTDDGQFYSTPRNLNRESPFEPCDALPAQFQESCYHELPQWWAQVYGRDYGFIGSLCASVTSEDLSKVCFLGIGKIVAPSFAYDSHDTYEACELITDERGAYLCRAAAAWNIALDGGGFEDAAYVCGETIPAFQFECPARKVHTP